MKVLFAEGLEESAVADKLGVIANMTDLMLSLCGAYGTDNIWFTLPEGATLMADTVPGNWINEDGSYVPYDACSRYWYLQAVEAGEMVFSDVEYDYRTGRTVRDLRAAGIRSGRDAAGRGRGGSFPRRHAEGHPGRADGRRGAGGGQPERASDHRPDGARRFPGDELRGSRRPARIRNTRSWRPWSGTPCRGKTDVRLVHAGTAPIT